MTRRGPGEGSIYPRGDGRWEGAVHMGYENGKRVRRFAIGHSRKEVADKLALLQQARDESRPIPDQRAKLGPFLRRWLDETAKPTLRASTYSSYDDILRLHLIPGLGRIAVAKLAPAEVQDGSVTSRGVASWTGSCMPSRRARSATGRPVRSPCPRPSLSATTRPCGPSPRPVSGFRHRSR